MKKVTPADGYIVFMKFFADLVRQEARTVVWKLTPEGRNVYEDVVVTSFKYQEGIVNFSDPARRSAEFAQGEIYVYAKSAGVIFKAATLGEAHRLSLRMPQELGFLEEPDVHVLTGSSGINESHLPWKVKRLEPQTRSQHDTDIFEAELAQISTSEEDKLFADMREAPRLRPKKDKIITCQRSGEPDTSQNFLLFDLSRGGLGFKIPDEELFSKGDIVEITALEGQRLDTPLYGQVMGLRNLEPEDIGWKVGLKFVEG